MLKQVPVLGIWQVLEISTKVCGKARPTHTREWVFPPSKPAEAPQRSEANSSVVSVLKRNQSGWHSLWPQISSSLDREMRKYREKNSTWWAQSGHNKRIPGGRTSVLNLGGGVEFGVAKRIFQVEKNILSKCRKFKERERQVWPHGRVSKTDWVLKSLDVNQWAVRLFQHQCECTFTWKRRSTS